jgi:serine/threonine-protein kinase
VLEGKYRLEEILRQGGMGSLYVAHNLTLDVRVAVKVIHLDITEEEDESVGAYLAERLLQEARVAARLGHPAIVRLFDFGRSPDGNPFIVMELLEGEDLGEALARRGRLKATKAARILMPIAHALATAHDSLIVHRDVKPSNIFLAYAAPGRIQPKLIDFGVAKVHERRAHRLTQVGLALGTPDYMSPEQARAEDVDALADVWGFCVVLYEMVTGELPFQGANGRALLAAIANDAPLPLSAHGLHDPGLDEVLRHGLEKRREDRWPSMWELGRALASWLRERGVRDDICGTSLQNVWLDGQGRAALADPLASIPPPSLEQGGSPQGAGAVIAGDVEGLPGAANSTVAPDPAPLRVVVPSAALPALLAPPAKRLVRQRKQKVADVPREKLERRGLRAGPPADPGRHSPGHAAAAAMMAPTSDLAVRASPRPGPRPRTDAAPRPGERPRRPLRRVVRTRCVVAAVAGTVLSLALLVGWTSHDVLEPAKDGVVPSLVVPSVSVVLQRPTAAPGPPVPSAAVSASGSTPPSAPDASAATASAGPTSPSARPAARPGSTSTLVPVDYIPPVL